MPGAPRSKTSFMSSPAQKAWPVPVNTATSKSGLSLNSVNAANISVRSSNPRAFILSGRFN